jgi:hypothetical protein
MVFASSSDHMRWHRAGGPYSGVAPLFIGSSTMHVAEGVTWLWH